MAGKRVQKAGQKAGKKAGMKAGKKAGQKADRKAGKKASQAADQQPADQTVARFPRFKQLPAEIQSKILLESIGDDPKFHVLQVARVQDTTTGTWSLAFYPVAKGLDESGYRMYDRLTSVDATAADAVRHEAARRKHNQTSQYARLPFKRLDAHIDAEKDLVVLDFAKYDRQAFGYFHPENQILNATGNKFDGDAVARQFESIQKVAIKWSGQHHPCQDFRGNFRCSNPVGIWHDNHEEWFMCPEEVCGLLNCFPNLREFHVILDPSHTKEQQDLVDIYIKNFFSYQLDPKQGKIDTIFRGVDTSYIEMDKHLAVQLSPPEYCTLDYFLLDHLYPIRRMISALKHHFFVPDFQPLLSQEHIDELSRMFRLSLPQRQDLKVGILLAVTDARRDAWKGKDERTFLISNRNDPIYWEMYRA